MTWYGKEKLGFETEIQSNDNVLEVKIYSSCTKQRIHTRIKVCGICQSDSDL